MATGTIEDPIILRDDMLGGFYDSMVHRKTVALTKLQRIFLDSYTKNKNTAWWATYQEKLQSSFSAGDIIEIVGEAITAGNLKVGHVFKILSRSNRKFKLYLEHPHHDPYQTKLPPPTCMKGHYIWRVITVPVDRHNFVFIVGSYENYSPPHATDQNQMI